MRQVNTIMSEFLRIFPRYEFEKLEKQYKGNYYAINPCIPCPFCSNFSNTLNPNPFKGTEP